MNFLKSQLRGVGASMVVAVILFAFPVVSMADTSLPSARDFQADARTVERTGFPLVVMVSLPGCPHCELVRRAYLLPLLRDSSVIVKPLIRQVEINGQNMLRDLNGETISHAEFANRYKIKFAPTVLFLDANGQMLADSLVGAMIPDFYGAHLDAALAESKARLQKRGQLKSADRAS